MAEGIRIRTDDVEWERIKKEMRNPKRGKLLVGVLDGADRKHPNADVTVGQIAVWNEYGTQNMPARSFARNWAILHKDMFAKQLAAAARTVILGGTDERVALGNLGVRYSKSMQQRIKDGIPPPNSPVTLARKDGETPLIDTSTLLDAITFKIVKDK